MTCVCGHDEFLHTNQSCLKWFLGCGCTSFHPDDGEEHGGDVFGEGWGSAYDGQYRGRYSL
jgi:hypothetical protein